METVLVWTVVVVALAFGAWLAFSAGAAHRRVAELMTEAQSLRRAWAEAEAQYAQQAATLAEERRSRQEWQRLTGAWKNQSQAWEQQSDEYRRIAEGFQTVCDGQRAELEQLKLQLMLRPIVDATRLLPRTAPCRVDGCSLGHDHDGMHAEVTEACRCGCTLWVVDFDHERQSTGREERRHECRLILPF